MRSFGTEALGAQSPGTLHTRLGAAFQPSLLRSSGKHAHVGQLRPSWRLEGLCQSASARGYVRELLGARYLHCQRSIAFAGRAYPAARFTKAATV